MSIVANTITFESIAKLQASSKLLTTPGQMIIITDKSKGGNFKVVRKGAKEVDGGVVIKGDLRYNIERVYYGNVKLHWFGNNKLAFEKALRYCEANSETLEITGDFTGYNLEGQTIILPEGVKFKSATSFLHNGTLQGNNTELELNHYHPIFNSNIILSGTWKGNTVTPQNFGAKTNPTNTVFENSCTANIQAALDSPLRVHFPSGNYYIDTTIYGNRSKHITLDKATFTSDAFDKNNPTYALPDHARIYTNLDIDFFVIRTKQWGLEGGVMDAQYVTNGVTDRAIFRLDMNYELNGGIIDTTIEGNEDELELEGNGITGVLFDNEGITSVHGYVAGYNIKGIFINVKKAVWVQLPKNHTNYTWTTNNHFDLQIDGCKQGFVIETGSAFTVKGIVQARHTLAESEKDLQFNLFNCNKTVIDVMAWDVYDDATVAPYKPKYPVVVDTGFSNYHVGLGAISQWEHVKHNDNTSFSPPISDPNHSIITKSHNDNQFVISPFHNQLAAAPQRMGATLKGHKGAGFDFDTNLDESGLPETSDITIQNPLAVFSTKPTISNFNIYGANFDADNDFIEMVAEYPFGDIHTLAFNIRGGALNDALGTSMFKRIQVINIYQGVSTVRNFYPDQHSSTIVLNKIGNTDKLVIRFIGNTEPSKPIRIMDICPATIKPLISPLISVDGGERIYGSLDVDRLRVKDNSLETTPINGTIETDGINLYFVAEGVRKQIAFV